MVGAAPDSTEVPGWGYVLMGSVVAAMAGAFYVDARTPPAPVAPRPRYTRPRYARLPIPTGSADRRAEIGLGLVLLAGAGGAWFWYQRRSAAQGGAQGQEDLETVEPEAPPVVPSTPASGAVAIGKSQNGWPAHPDPEVVKLVRMTIPLRSGKSVTLPLRAEIAPALVEMVRWWDANVEPVNPADTGSYNYRSIRGYTQLSNHASGTAVDINGSRHKFSARGTVSPAIAAAISAKAQSLGLRWGGNYKNRADEMHFEVNTSPPAAAVAASEAVWQAKYGEGRRVS